MAENEQLATTGGSGAPKAGAIMALDTANSGMLAEVIKENFGATGLRLSDLDRIKIPGSAGIAWEVPTIEKPDGESRTELVGVIVAWADKKAWWPVKFGAGDSANTPPACKSDDMVHGTGLPTLAISDNESKLVEQGKAQRTPTSDTGGFLCTTCPHNVFGGAPEGTGKWCKDMRFIVMLLQDAVLPVLIRVPPTSLLPLRNYFKRLAGSGKRYYSTVTRLTLQKEENAARIKYSSVVPTAVRFLDESEQGAARAYHDLMQPMLERQGAVDAGLQEKAAGSDEQHAAESPHPQASEQQQQQPAAPAGEPASIRDVPRKSTKGAKTGGKGAAGSDAADDSTADDQTVF
jgi:hypothetical protein